MNLDKKTTLKIIGIIFVSIVFFAIAMHLGVVLTSVQGVLSVFAPVFIGAGMALIVNIPLRFFELRVFKKLTFSTKHKVWKKIKRPVCLALSVILLLGAIAAVFAIILPQIIDALKRFFVNLPGYMDSLNSMINDLLSRFNFESSSFVIDIDWETTSENVLNLLNEHKEVIAENALGTAISVGNALFNIVFGFVLAIYILASKESLGKTGKKLAFAIFSRERARSVLKVARMSNKAFSGFVSGQTLEAVTIGVLCFIGMLILKMPYAMLISFIIAITAFIPIFGPIIGTVIGAFIILLEEPIQAIWFVIFVIVLQQIESNVIYPKIMGSSVSLPGLWVLIAVTVFGGLWGVGGIIVSIPICSVLYALFDEWMSRRLIERNIEHHHYEPSSNSEASAHGIFKFVKKIKDKRNQKRGQNDSSEMPEPDENSSETPETERSESEQ